LPAHDHHACDRRQSAAGSQVLTSIHVFIEHRCLTLDITGRGVWHRMNDQKLARRAPVHVVVMPAPVSLASPGHPSRLIRLSSAPLTFRLVLLWPLTPPGAG
jgi:hypothetical protein